MLPRRVALAACGRHGVFASAVRCRGIETASEKLFRDAAQEEETEKAMQAKIEAAGRAQEPVWTGEERFEDAVLRMLVDKYKPMRRGEDARTSESARLSKAQRPTARPTSAVESVGANGVRIRKTGNNPWDLSYMPGPSPETRVYRGKYAHIDIEAPASEMKKKLQKHGVTPNQLPLDNAKAMGQVRESLRRSVLRDRIETALDKKVRYPDRKNQAEPSDEDQNKPLLGVVTAAKGLAGIAEMRIEEAIRTGSLQKNSLRGKPIPYDHNEGNAHLQREEFVLNRMVQRQGGAPPWVEINIELATEERSLRQRIQAAWICRALYALEFHAPWQQMEPVHVDWHMHDNQPTDIPDYTFAIRNDAQRHLVDWARNFRDAQWVVDQRSYHEEAVYQLNQVIRRYNNIAPFTARRLLYTKASFLRDTLDRTYPLVVEAASARLRGLRLTGAQHAAEAPSAPKAPIYEPILRWFRPQRE